MPSHPKTRGRETGSEGDEPRQKQNTTHRGGGRSRKKGVFQRILEPLKSAREHKRTGLTELLRNSFASGNNSWRALVEAAAGGRLDEVRCLLDKGVDIEASESRSGRTPLIVAAEMGHVDVVKTLIAAGAKVEATSRTSGRTPLMRAAQHGYLEIVTLLVHAGANVNARGRISGRTPLMRAARNGHYQTAELLIRYGAKVSGRDNHGATALDLARRHSRFDVAELLLKNGAQAGDTHWRASHSSRGRDRAGIDQRASAEHRATSGSFDPSLEDLAGRIRFFHERHNSEEERRRLVEEVTQLEHYYEVLGCDPTASDEDVKQKYRKLAKEYHPDHVRAKGLPQDFQDFAGRRFLEIKEAYEKIRSFRRMHDS